MRTLCLPFDDKNRAKTFKKHMVKPWIAEVYLDDESEFYRWDAGDFTRLYSDDDMGMYLDEIAERKKKNFDIRPYVKEKLKPIIEWASSQLEEYDLSSLNLVRESLGMKPISKDRKLGSAKKTFSYIKNLLVENKFKISSSELYTINKVRKNWTYWTSKTVINVPKKYLGKSISYGEIIMHRRRGNPLKILSGLKFINEKKYTSNPKMLSFFFRNANSSEMKNSSYNSKVTSACLKFEEGKSDKFWIAKVVKSELHIRFGRTGTKGRNSVKQFKSRIEAKAGLYKKISEKKKKGYKEVY